MMVITKSIPTVLLGKIDALILLKNKKQSVFETIHYMSYNIQGESVHEIKHGIVE